MSMVAKFTDMIKSIISSYKTANFITATFDNIDTPGYSLENITIITPYGEISYPVGNIQGLIIPIQGSKKSYAAIGFSQSIPPSAYTPAPGDSGKFSQNYIMMWQAQAIKAYRINDNDYNATLISGEWVNKILQDLIADNNTTLRTYINEAINEFLTTHTHSGVTSGSDNSGPSVQPITNISTNSTLNNDNTAIDNNNTLIADGGTTP